MEKSINNNGENRIKYNTRSNNDLRISIAVQAAITNEKYTLAIIIVSFSTNHPTIKIHTTNQTHIYLNIKNTSQQLQKIHPQTGRD